MQPSAKRLLRKLVIIAALASLLFAAFVRWRALWALRNAQQEVASAQDLAVAVHSLSFDSAHAASASSFEWFTSPAVYSGAGIFQGHLFLCGAASLDEYDASGVPLHSWHVGRDLPSSPLVRLAQGVLADASEPELLIATASEGVLAFNGRSFRQILPADAAARTITAILPAGSGHLILGTHKRGVLVYDGKHLAPLHATLSGLAVTELAGAETDLWIGTQDSGVFHWHAGETNRFDQAQGLPDAQVLSLTVSGDDAYAGTAMGVAEFVRGRFARVIAPDAFARALLLRGRTLVIGTMDQGVREVALDAARIPADRPAASTDFGEMQQLFSDGSGLYALARQGLYSRGPRAALGWKKLLEPPLGETSANAAVLADRNVSALAVDDSGRLWVGYFDRGLDIVEPDGQHARHVEDEHVFCVNRILPGAAISSDAPARAATRNPAPQKSSGAIAVATANGLVVFDRAGNEQQLLARADGLIADHVTDVVRYRDSLALATPAGLTFLDAAGARSLYAFHGLVNNHVYALGVSGDELLAGTLGGLSVLDRETILSNYTTATSGLRHNWITAVVPFGHDWLIGTYGAGVFRLDASGRIQPFDSAGAGVVINPGAMLATDHHVFVGTLGKGLRVYNRDADRWTTIDSGLPSTNVTAFAASGGVIYIGTDNGLVRASEQEFDQ